MENDRQWYHYCDGSLTKERRKIAKVSSVKMSSTYQEAHIQVGAREKKFKRDKEAQVQSGAYQRRGTFKFQQASKFFINALLPFEFHILRLLAKHQKPYVTTKTKTF